MVERKPSTQPDLSWLYKPIIYQIPKLLILLRCDHKSEQQGSNLQNNLSNLRLAQIKGRR